MGLDLVVEGCAKPGHEPEWRAIVERSFSNFSLPEADTIRFAEISIPAHERLGAPRVGYDQSADDWIVKTRGAANPEQIAELLREFHGFYAVSLVSSDGVPEYSHGSLNDELDATSFRGSFLNLCSDVLLNELLQAAWEHKMPEAAVNYGQALLAAADAAQAGPRTATASPKRGFLSRLGFGRGAPEPAPFDEQLKIVRAAGRWFVFWGERGHPVRAWF